MSSVEPALHAQKQYFRTKQPTDTLTVEGVVYAEHAEAVMADFQGGRLRTTDPRIEWEDDCVALADQGWEYLDFSFEVSPFDKSDEILDP